MNRDQYVVVTGGSGFIGSGAIQHLNDQGWSNIIVVDELGTDEKWKNLVGKKFSDILEKEQLFDWLEGRESEIGAFIHLGACSDTTEKDASYLLKNNYQYSVQLAEYALHAGIRFIYASSAATYGDGTKGFQDGIEEIEKLAPLNMYGYTKHLFDLWLKNEGVFDQVVGLKYFNVFGPNEYHKGRMCSVVLKQVPQVQKEGVVHLFQSSDPEKYSDGGQMRDFIYVKDAVRITCAFLENETTGLYNVGTGKPNTWNTLASSIFKGLDKKVNISYIPMPEDLLGKYQNYTCASVDLLLGALGDVAKCAPLEDTVVEYVKDYILPERTW